MKNKSVKLVLLSISIIFFGIAIRRYFFKNWAPYYQKKLYKEPRPLLLKALDCFNNTFQEKRALDLGAGTGNDTAYLLKHGWKVWANDIEPEAIKVIASRNDIEPYAQNLILMQKSFIDLPWAHLPQFNLIYAGYSLPFAHPLEFMKIWNHIVQAIKPGGIFAGHFFGEYHGAFNWWVKRKMSFFTKEQLLRLFDDFHIDLFEELHETSKSGVIDHSFNVVAKKI